MLPTRLRRYSRFKRPKHQSGSNLVCPTTKNEMVIYCTVLVLATAVIGMQVYLLLTKAVMVKEVVEHANHCIRSLAAVRSFINLKIDLPGNSFTVHSK